MFIESSSPLISGAHLWAKLVALLKELLVTIGACVFYKHFTATRFFPTDSQSKPSLIETLTLCQPSPLRLLDAINILFATDENLTVSHRRRGINRLAD